MAATYSSNDDDGGLGSLWWLGGVAVLFWLTFVCGSHSQAKPRQNQSPAATSATAAPSTPGEQASTAPAGLPLAKLYFEIGKTELAQTAGEHLNAVIAHLKSHESAKAVISGYHDPTGDKAQNEELAKNRAKAVRETLKAAGIVEERIVMQKPIETTGSGDLAEARRVEVSIQP